ncbi:hypothetical protein J1N35_037069 [Gossypium stocksii]|uniref:Uncharacterized protein n=1 Tax=Gossypium stocksii TaxID=47602 RepID=A0A9D3UJ67_9ROSI|nr:hypothetical protein J1N35_037069 [Gossypium stocksii]
MVVADPMNLSHIDFDFFNDISIETLDFNVYNPKGKEWEKLQLKWKQIARSFLPNSLELKGDKNIEGPSDLEQTLGGAEQTEDAPNSNKASADLAGQHIGEEH